MTNTRPKSARTRKPAGVRLAETPVAIVITADHVYLPVDASGNVGGPWAASDVSTSRVLKRTRLTVPADLARFLSDRNQAEILSAPLEAGAVVKARLLGFDPASGLAQWWLENGEGIWAQKSSQQVEALLDLNREAQDHCDPYNAARDVRMVARIPLIVIAKWRNELGVDYWNPDHQDKVDALLNDADWRWLRIDGGMV